jgi:hypothetical protein
LIPTERLTRYDRNTVLTSQGQAKGTDAIKMTNAAEIPETGAMNCIHVRIEDGH